MCEGHIYIHQYTYTCKYSLHKLTSKNTYLNINKNILYISVNTQFFKM